MASTEHLYHLVPKASWDDLKSSNTLYYPPTYKQDGFIHLTKEPNLLLGVANHFYKADPGEYVVLVLDPAKLSSEVKYEPAAPVGDKSQEGLPAEEEQVLFPHLYGTIDYSSVTEEVAVQRDSDGTFLSFQGL